MPPRPSQRSARTLAILCENWSGMVSFAESDEHGIVVEEGRVVGVAPATLLEGVDIGMTVRTAKTMVPKLPVRRRDLVKESRAFESVLDLLMEVSPFFSSPTPGECFLPLGAVVRFFGGEEPVRLRVREVMRGVTIGAGTHGVDLAEGDLAIGIADSIFASRLAARFSVVVPLGETANFLSDLPLAYCGMHTVVDALEEFGIRRIGEFLRLDPRDVANRFGREGRRLYGRCALTEDEDPPRDRTPPEGAIICRFDEDLDGVEQVVFAVSRLVAERYERFADEGISPTTIDVAIHCDAGSLVRRWHFPDGSLSTEVIDRLRWQIEGMVRQRSIDGRMAEVWDAWAVREVVLTPVMVAAHQGRQLDLDGDRTSSEEMILRALAKLSARLGEDHVQMIREDAGRAPRERYRLLPWQPSVPGGILGQGTRARRSHPRRLDSNGSHVERMPWPGSIPGPQPAVVYEA
ncbi:MAG: hypothetical protein ACP5PJ_06030, partial [Acidimicrobiales bacterium]